jgi:hypothetical protein
VLLQQLRTQGNPLKEVLTPGRNRYPVGAPFVFRGLEHARHWVNGVSGIIARSGGRAVREAIILVRQASLGPRPSKEAEPRAIRKVMSLEAVTTADAALSPAISVTESWDAHLAVVQNDRKTYWPRDATLR